MTVAPNTTFEDRSATVVIAGKEFAVAQNAAKIEMKDGAPVVTWSPNLNGEGVRGGVRVYRVWGKANLGDASWSEVETGGEADFRFFRVTVEMP